jgi:hypothetical protein
MKITMTKEAFNKKVSLLTSKLSTELRKKIGQVLYFEHYIIRFTDLGTKKIWGENTRKASKFSAR